MTTLLYPIIDEAIADSSASTSTTFIEIATIDVEATTQYLVVASGEFYVNNSDRYAEARIELNDATLALFAIYNGSQAGAYQPFHFSRVLTTDGSGSQHIDMDMRMVNSFGSDNITSRNVRLYAYEVVA